MVVVKVDRICDTCRDYLRILAYLVLDIHVAIADSLIHSVSQPYSFSRCEMTPAETMTKRLRMNSPRL